ncbi:MAG TPA: flagellar export chaperone FliS [Dyella sp.]|uniref:flagellar export chaperone FliS n=1 Tax=Dyella sp. TaxID=1869338 RepID=UPI002F945261
MTYGLMRKASSMYQQTSARGGVEDADPHQLTAMLLDGVLDRINQARGHIYHRDVAAKGVAFSKALAILAELRRSLNPEAGGELAGRLAALYEYVTRRLLHAQLNNDLVALDEAARLLTPIRDSWHAIRSSYLAQQKSVTTGASA